MTSSDSIDWKKDSAGHIPNTTENLSKVKSLLNSTGSGFCLAKFTQVTMHLGTGMTHACHHPSPHKIPLSEIEKDPAALFNTSHLKQVRREMLTGGKPSECDYCWRVEQSGGNSDRFYKSIESWALPNHDRIASSNPDDNIYPQYLEVDFSNVCNFKCIYCGPEFSSQWVDELKRNGPIKVLEGTVKEQWVQGWQDLDTLNYKNREFNPYVDAFWKWFPLAYPHLKTYRITGGEPLLSKETFRSMDWLIENPNPKLEFNINTNLGVPEKIWEKFVEKVTTLAKGNCVKRIVIFTSADGWGERAAYARVGMDFDLFKKRYEQLLRIHNVRAVVMCAFNILSVTSIKQLLEWQLSLKKLYNSNSAGASFEEATGFSINEVGESFVERRKNNPDQHFTVGIDIPYIRHPQCLDAQYITTDLIQQYLIPALNFMASNLSNNSLGTHQGFEEYEFEKFKRICIQIMQYHKMGAINDSTVLEHRAKFYDFINEIDTRYGSDFTEVFPEMRDFFYVCKSARDNI